MTTTKDAQLKEILTRTQNTIQNMERLRKQLQNTQAKVVEVRIQKPLNNSFLF